MYEYTARILRVVDGDSIHADVDLGFDISRRMKLRLYGINAPELTSPEGKSAKAFLVALVEGKPVTLLTIKDRQEKYGRFLATIFLPGNRQSVNEQIVAAGHAVPYMAT